MACQIKRDKFGDVHQVLAANGKPSEAYQGLLDRLEKIHDTSSLRARFASWEGRHIMPITNKRELALALYKQLYSPAFKSWMGDWSRLAKVSYIDSGNGYLVEQLSKGVRIGLLDKNGEPKGEALDKVIQGPYNKSFAQMPGSTQPQKASKETIAKVQEFLSRIGAQVESVNAITIGGKKIGATGLVDPMRGLIQVAEGSLDVALTEEAMHIAVELIEQKDPKLFKQMMGQIGNYNLLTDVIRDYKGIKEYQLPDGKPDIAKLKKETIGKVLAQTIIDKNQGTNENPAFLAQAKHWWDRILDVLKWLFNKAGFNPFETAAEQVLDSTKDLGSISDLAGSERGIFLQKERDLIEKIRLNDKNVAEKDGKFEVNGAPIRNTVQEKMMDKLRDIFGRFTDRVAFNATFKAAQSESEVNMHQDMKDILDRYIDDEGNRRVEEEPHTNASALDPFDNTLYNTIEEHIKERLDTYPAGTKFFKYVNLYDSRTSTAGRADLIAVMPDSKVDLLQFKMPDVTAVSTDIPRIRQEAYNLEIEELRQILQNDYGISRKDFRMTRAIPIRATYGFLTPGDANSGYRIAEVKVGNVNTRLINDDVLLPVPSASESTGSERFDKFINRLRGLAKKMAIEKVSPDKRADKTARITGLLASIRKLQVQKKADQVLSSAALIVKRQQERYIRLNDSIEKTDPTTASLKELNKVASEILDEKDQIEIYSDLYRVFKEIFTEGTEEDKELLQKARNISDDAQDSVDGYWNLSVKFRTKKLAVKFGIRDEFKPEKNLTWYRRMVRSLSQSSIKAGAILWEMVSHINNSYHLEFNDRLERLENIQKEVKEWLGGRPVKELYSKIFQIDDKNRWNGKVIQKFSKDFYSELRDKQEKGGRQWVLDNIDVAAYKAWYAWKHDEVLANNVGARLHEDDVENDRRIKANIKSFEDTFDIDHVGSVTTANYKLKDFPLEKWESKEFGEIKSSPALTKLYNYWRDRLDESLELGMIEEHNGWSWFPNVRKNRLEKIISGGKLGFLSFKGDAEEREIARIDPVNQKPIDEIHANYVNDLYNDAKDTDGNYFRDYSEKSMDIFKVMALWEREIVRFKLKTESEGLARMLAYTEQGQGKDMEKGALATTKTGKLATDENGNPLPPISNDINARYIKDHIDAVYYSKGTANESDVSIDIPVKKAVDKINGFFGKEVISVSGAQSVTLSGVHGLQTLNRYFMTKTLGVNVFTAAANIFGGTINTYINQGKYFTKMDISEAEVEMVAGRFWSSEQSKKMAGLLAYFHPFLEDDSNEEIRKMSVSAAINYFSSDHLFFMQRYSDRHVNQVIAMSYIKNAIVRDGKILNIREVAKKELGYKDKWAGTREEAKAFQERLEKRVNELKQSPEALLNYTQIKGDKIEIPGMERLSETNLQFRAQILEFIKDALGNTSREDLSLYKRNVIMQSFFMFKNWIPRMLDVRGQSLKYNPGTQSYEWGRVRMLGRAVTAYLGGRISNLKKDLGGGHTGIVALAKSLYKEKQAYYAEQGEDFDMDEAEFIDMYIKGVRSEFKELLLGLGLMGIMIAARSAAPPRDDDPEKKNVYKWALRAIDKFQDEVNFFYNPKSFMDIVNGSSFPAVNLLVDIQRFISNGFAKAWYEMIGDEVGAGKEHPAKYLFRITPGVKELMNYVAIFNNDFAKEYGIKISSQNGSSR